MSTNGRIAALVVAALAGFGGLFLQGTGSNGLGLFILAVSVAIGTVFEGRYRGSKVMTQGQWQITGEHEIDHETGTILEVWYDPLTGERRYLPRGQRPG